MYYDLGNEVLNFLQINPLYVLKWIVVAIIVMVIFIPIAVNFKKLIEYYRRKRNLVDKRNKLIESNANDIIEIKNCMLGFNEVMIELMHDRISRKCKTYIRLGYIPDDEHDDFARKWNLYRNILKGNHGLEKRYERAIILPLESEFKASKELQN